MNTFQLCGLVTGIVLGLNAVSTGEQVTSIGDGARSARVDVVRMLDDARVQLGDIAGSTEEAIAVLRQKYGVPVSFISISKEAANPPDLRHKDVTLREALDELVKRRDEYTYSVMASCLVVYPKAWPLHKVVRGVEVREMPRWEAARALIAQLKRTYTEFESVVPPIIRGDRDRAALYADLVSLPGEGTVLEHFAALIGDNPNVVFSIVDWRNSGKRFFVLEQVQGSEEKRRMEAEENAARKGADE